ncbi:MAG: hypothetical protein D3906_03540 [Candidatus Electrothrix sp. AUS1_2]|nr:hypothetical protein [Candidatus Electrothrix sp. AUS1_2]
MPGDTAVVVCRGIGNACLTKQLVQYFSEEVKKKIMTKQTDIGNENHCRCFEPTSFAPEPTFPYHIPGSIDLPSPLRSGFPSFPPRKKLTSFFLFAYN